MTDTDTSADQKGQIRAEVATWRYTLQPTAQAAIEFVNRPPAQVAGQAAFSVRDNGQVDVFFFL
jgi:hypothetical protein